MVCFQCAALLLVMPLIKGSSSAPLTVNTPVGGSFFNPEPAFTSGDLLAAPPSPLLATPLPKIHVITTLPLTSPIAPTQRAVFASAFKNAFRAAVMLAGCLQDGPFATNTKLTYAPTHANISFSYAVGIGYRDAVALVVASPTQYFAEIPTSAKCKQILQLHMGRLDAGFGDLFVEPALEPVAGGFILCNVPPSSTNPGALPAGLSYPAPPPAPPQQIPQAAPPQAGLLHPPPQAPMRPAPPQPLAPAPNARVSSVITLVGAFPLDASAFVAKLQGAIATIFCTGRNQVIVGMPQRLNATSSWSPASFSVTATAWYNNKVTAKTYPSSCSTISYNNLVNSWSGKGPASCIQSINAAGANLSADGIKYGNCVSIA